MKWFGFWAFVIVVFIAAFIDPDRVGLLLTGAGKGVAIIVAGFIFLAMLFS